MNHFPFVYQATVFWYEDDKSSNYRIAGLGFCEDFTDAMRQIEEREGDALVSIEYLELIGERDETIIDIPPAWVKPISETEVCDMWEDLTKND